MPLSSETTLAIKYHSALHNLAPLQPLQLLALLTCPPLVLIADELRKRFIRHPVAVAFENPVFH